MNKVQKRTKGLSIDMRMIFDKRREKKGISDDTFEKIPKLISFVVLTKNCFNKNQYINFLYYCYFPFL